jgi:hypothetical protein
LSIESDLNDPSVSIIKAFPSIVAKDPEIMKGLVTVALREAITAIVDNTPDFGAIPSGHGFLVSFWGRDAIEKDLPPGDWTVMRVDADRIDDPDDDPPAAA